MPYFFLQCSYLIGSKILQYRSCLVTEMFILSSVHTCLPLCAKSPDHRKSTLSYKKYVCATYSKYSLCKRSFLFLSRNSPFKAHLILSQVSVLFTVSLSCCAAPAFTKTFAPILPEGNNLFWRSSYGWQIPFTFLCLSGSWSIKYSFLAKTEVTTMRFKKSSLSFPNTPLLKVTKLI